MGKSLTETAKSILMKENYPSVDPMGAGHPDRDAKSLTPSKASLAPNSKGAEGQIVNPGATSTPGTQAQDLGPALTKAGDVPPSAKASGATKKDTSPSSQSRKGATPAETTKKQAEVMEEDIEQDDTTLVAEAEETEGDVVEEEIEISEELEEFIDQMVAEGYSEEEIAAAIDENFEVIEEEMVAEEDTMEGYEVDMSEDINALFQGEELSEEFKEKAKTIFEAAVKAKVEQELAIIEEAYAETLEEQVSEIQEQLSSNVDDYLNYVVEQWVADNEVAIEAGLRTELTEEFISGLRTLFAEHYIDIPEDKVSVIEELGSKVSELEDKLNEEIERNVTLNKMLSESRKIEVLNNSVDGLTATQAEKLKSLAEGVEYSSDEEFAAKIKTLRENYFPTTAVKKDNALDKAESSTDGKGMIAETVQGPMAAYVRTLGKTLPK